MNDQTPWAIDVLIDRLNELSRESRGKELSEREVAAVRSAITTRGKHKGRLKANAPSSWGDPWGNAAWNGLQPNAFKVQFGCVAFLADAEREFFDFLNLINTPAWLDRDRAALQSMGVW